MKTYSHGYDNQKNKKLTTVVNLFYLLFTLAIIIFSTSCVSKKKYKELSTHYTQLDSNFQQLSGQYQALNKNKNESEQLSKSELEKLNAELQNKLSALESSNKKVAELQAAMQKQKQSQKDLLNRITNALVGFNAGDLTAELRKDGKVYVSLSEKLLFKSGKYDVDPKGKEALQKLAGVLTQQPDLDIIVEGHTDTIPLKKGGVLKDNIDLSVMRATSIVRLLSEDFGVSPKQLYASGRGESFPLAPNTTPEGRQANRRTEIILSPRIQELHKLLEES
ncbi:MAG: flagellar motor protein MotB [Bacteroidetes bacterium]|nr:flagellar motor protein MotB [Bacteroidota bacterium]